MTRMAQFIAFDPSKQPKCKVELHVHLDGAVRVATVWELATKKGIDLEGRTLEKLIDDCCVKTPSTLANFLSVFNLFKPATVGDAGAIERIAYEYCEDASNQGVLYAEVRYCPHLFCNPPPSNNEVLSGNTLTPKDVVKCVNKGLARGSEEFKITVKTILCCIRANPEWSNEIVKLCEEFKDEGVVGIDVAGDESKGLASKEIIEAFQLAAKLGIHRTVHAGEAGPASNVKIALEDMLAERIGHGYHVVDDPDLYKNCLERGTHFETCPYSSCLTGSVSLACVKHPIVKFAEDGANFSISRDDPTVIQKTLDEEYTFLRGFGLKDVHFTRANFNAARNCFLPEKEKNELLLNLAKIYGVYNV